MSSGNETVFHPIEPLASSWCASSASATCFQTSVVMQYWATWPKLDRSNDRFPFEFFRMTGTMMFLSRSSRIPRAELLLAIF